MPFLGGQLILDGGKLVGSEFHKTVVLVCQHDAQGAFGLVLNRPTTERLENCLAEPLPEALGELPLYVGGPVSPRALTCLVHDPALEQAAEDTILPGLKLVHQLDELLTGQWALEPPARLKFFAGYAGWAPAQLDSEMKTGAWLTHPASLELVFPAAPKTLWRSILQDKGPAYRLLAEAPDDVSQN